MSELLQLKVNEALEVHNTCPISNLRQDWAGLIDMPAEVFEAPI